MTDYGKRALLSHRQYRPRQTGRARQAAVTDAKRLIGPGAGSVKYDILTALGLIGLHGIGGMQMSMLRLTAMVTARYNWRADEVSVGQRDLARMWGVNERTVKREVKRLTEMRLLLCVRRGVRGRVAAYRLNLPEIAGRSRGLWAAVGPDFAERMTALEPAGAKVVQLHPAPPAAEAGEEGQGGQTGTWRAVRARLRARDPALFASWFDGLQFVERDGSDIVLRAASVFVGRYVETHLAPVLHAAIEAELGPFDRLRIRCDP